MPLFCLHGSNSLTYALRIFYVLSTISTAAKVGLYEQNCAAKKLCNKPLEQRDSALHETLSTDPKGHLKPLGHKDFEDSWAGAIDEVQEMDPHTFWTKYHPKKPFLLKNFAKKSPAFLKWKNDSYLVENFGKYKAKCENKNEDRLTDYCNMEKRGQFIQCGKDTIPYVETHMKIDKFMSRQDDPNFDKYIITQMPDAMGPDFWVPPFHLCGYRHTADRPEGREWMTQMYENNFWFSKNEGDNFSTSVIHYDMNHQIMCLFDGTKEWIMWDMSTEAKNIPMWSKLYNQRTHTATGSDDSPIDGERVDLKRWPKFARAKWYNTTMQAGDCLYTPALLLHYVRSWDRNVAAMTMFQQRTQYDESCGGASKAPTTPVPLSDFDYLWSFPEEDESLFGWNVIKMGYPDWKREYLWGLADMIMKGVKVDKKAFAAYFRGYELENKKSRLRQVFKALPKDENGVITNAKALFQSKEMRFLLKDIATEQEGGRGGQEEDVDMERYSMDGWKPSDEL